MATNFKDHSPEQMIEQSFDILRRYCKRPVVTSLLREFRHAEATERRVLGRSRGAADDLPSVQEQLDRFITLTSEHLQADDQCLVLLDIGDLFKGRGEMGRAEELYSRALVKARATHQKSLVGEAYLRRGEVYSRKGLWRQSISDLKSSRDIFEDLKHQSALGRVENVVGTNYAEQGQLSRAVESFERALVLFERTSQHQMAGVVQMNLGIINNIIGNHDRALTHFKRAQSSFEALGDQVRLGELHHNLGMTFLTKGLLKESIREFGASSLLAIKNHSVGLIGLSCLGKANAYHRMRDYSLALQLVNQAVGLFTQCNDRLSLADAYRLKGMIHRDMDSLHAAESYLATSVRINEEFGNQLNLAESYVEIGLLAAKQKRQKEAEVAFRKAIIGFRRVGALEDVRKTTQVMKTMGEGKP
jgi:tetratricopeptide (TPR) repeat protein